jgi:ABC-type multidrug transport system fused ATPase/permease subunit
MPIIVASQRYVKVVANGFSERYNKLLASKQSEVRNLIALRLEANVMCAQAFLMARWDRSAGPTREALHDSNFWASASQLLFQMLTMAVYLSALLWVLFSVAAGTMSLSAGISFYGYVTSVWSALNSLAGISKRVLVNAGSVNALMDMVDAAAAAARGDKQQKPPPGAVPAHTQPLALDVEDAHLVFPGAAAPSLDGLSLHVRAGDYVALMGASGSGKTTLLKLVAGAVPPQRGAVRGVDPRSVAIVSQRPELLIGSVRDNIAFGHECSQEDVEQAARDAAVHDVIERLPEKYDTVLGDDEASRGLSGGEQLRLTLARALCRQPALLVLDECTAALDSASEALVLANLAHVHQQRRTATTILMATHSHAAAAAADYVVMLAQGRVVEQGPYAALLQQHGALWRLQQVVQHGIRPATTEGHASTTRSSQEATTPAPPSAEP